MRGSVDLQQATTDCVLSDDSVLRPSPSFPPSDSALMEVPIWGCLCVLSLGSGSPYLQSQLGEIFFFSPLLESSCTPRPTPTLGPHRDGERGPADRRGVGAMADERTSLGCVSEPRVRSGDIQIATSPSKWVKNWADRNENGRATQRALGVRGSSAEWWKGLQLQLGWI